jgi:hypothetical protein
MILVALGILAGVFVAATGRGGELAYEPGDHAPLDLGPVSATDVAMLRPPTAMWGYNMQVTDEALERIAQALRDRDVTIAYLQQRLTGAVPAVPAVPPAPGAPATPAAPPVPAATGPDPLLSDFPTASAPADPATQQRAPWEQYPQEQYPQDPGRQEPGSAEYGS